MAKSKNGGTRAYIRGRIGSDVYSVGKNGKGQRQQVVRSLAESVANPRTSGQMAGRMIMSTVMQAASFLSPIIDHSFDGLPKGQPSISEFIRLNYGVLKAQDGQYNEYQEKGIKNNKLIVSKGAGVWPANVVYGQVTNDDLEAYGKYGVLITLASETPTVADLRAALQSGSVDDFVTVIRIKTSDDDADGFIRFTVDQNADAATALSAANVGTIVKTETVGLSPIIGFEVRQGDGYSVVFLNYSGSARGSNGGAILSTKVDGAWKHTSCQLEMAETATNWAEALATYPTGSEQFLNGGDL